MDTETARHYELLKDDPAFDLAAGDVLACVPYAYDHDKLTVAFRVSDRFDPQCNVYREHVRRVDGKSLIRLRDEAPYGFEPVDADLTLDDHGVTREL